MSLTRHDDATRSELFLRALLGFLAFALPPVVVMTALQALGPAPTPARQIERQMAAHFCSALVVLALATLMRPQATWRLDPRTAVRTGATYLCFLIPWLLFVWGYGALLERLGHPLTPQPHLDYFAREQGLGFGFLLALVTVTIVGPIAEEIVFRGYLSEALRRGLGPWPGEIVCALIFGLLHEVQNAVPIAALGLFFAILRRNTGSLAPAVLAHALHNTVTVALAMGAPKLLPTLQR